jgi:DNA repair photolyase
MCRFSGHNGEEWGSFIDVKRGGALSGNLDCKNVLFGSVTDPYNPLEKKYRVTRAAFERLSEQKNRANIEVLTKSPLVLRDMDLFKQMANVRVGISLSTTDEGFARLIEKHVATPKQRLDAVRKLHSAGIPVYLFVSPIFPYLSDWRTVADAVDGYVDMVCFENLNLRADYSAAVLEVVKFNYPNIYPEIVKIYSDKSRFREYWNHEAAQIREYMNGKNYKLYFFHEEIKKK